MKGAAHAALGLLALGLLTLAGCTPTDGEAVLELTGQVPLSRSAKENDKRALKFSCSRCGRELPRPNETMCQNPQCAVEITWPTQGFACPNCDGSGRCPACAQWNQQDQRCYYCGGSGWVSGYVPCPNCRQGRCAVCAENAGKCDFCGGSGKVTATTTRPGAPQPSEGAPTGP